MDYKKKKILSRIEAQNCNDTPVNRGQPIKAPSLKTSQWPLLELMRINEVDNKEFVPRRIIAFIIACFEVTQLVLQKNRRPEFLYHAWKKTLRKLTLKNEVFQTLSNLCYYSQFERDTVFCYYILAELKQPSNRTAPDWGDLEQFFPTTDRRFQN